MSFRHSRLPGATLLAALILAIGCGWTRSAAAFDFEDVAAQAKALAAKPYQRPDTTLPKELADLGYDHYRDIRFKPDHALWHAQKLPFELQFFHEGLYYNMPVRINEVVGHRVREVQFSPDQFDYGKNKIDPTKLRNLGYAGFRVHYAVNTPKYKDEVLVFLGASYFRALGKDQRYGLSARALAVDTALLSGEEFPRFTQFWIERPGRHDKQLTIYALLNSKSVAGAYRFILKPGIDTVMEVKARVYMRSNVSKIGFAPLTSMFYSGQNQHGPADDYRPGVHDSDGLSIESGTGEWLWRPLVNPRRLLVTSFALNNPVGFGLMQRERDFCDYEDLEARYDLRPSTWVETVGRWGSGRDNIVSYWVPDNPPQAGQSFDLQYRLNWEMETATTPPQAWVMQTLRGHGYLRNPDDSIGFAVDFTGPALNKLSPDEKVEGIISVDANGELLERNTLYNPVTQGRRLTMRIHRVDNDKPVELRAYLRGPDSATISETWSYILPPGGP
jgi:glucans biosynthesis protein